MNPNTPGAPNPLSFLSWTCNTVRHNVAGAAPRLLRGNGGAESARMGFVSLSHTTTKERQIGG